MTDELEEGEYIDDENAAVQRQCSVSSRSVVGTSRVSLEPLEMEDETEDDAEVLRQKLLENLAQSKVRKHAAASRTSTISLDAASTINRNTSMIKRGNTNKTLSHLANQLEAAQKKRSSFVRKKRELQESLTNCEMALERTQDEINNLIGRLMLECQELAASKPPQQTQKQQQAREIPKSNIITVTPLREIKTSRPFSKKEEFDSMAASSSSISNTLKMFKLQSTSSSSIVPMLPQKPSKRIITMRKRRPSISRLPLHKRKNSFFSDKVAAIRKNILKMDENSGMKASTKDERAEQNELTINNMSKEVPTLFEATIKNNNNNTTAPFIDSIEQPFEAEQMPKTTEMEIETDGQEMVTLQTKSVVSPTSTSFSQQEGVPQLQTNETKIAETTEIPNGNEISQQNLQQLFLQKQQDEVPIAKIPEHSLLEDGEIGESEEDGDLLVFDDLKEKERKGEQKLLEEHSDKNVFEGEKDLEIIEAEKDLEKGKEVEEEKEEEEENVEIGEGILGEEDQEGDEVLFPDELIMVDESNGEEVEDGDGEMGHEEIVDEELLHVEQQQENNEQIVGLAQQTAESRVPQSSVLQREEEEEAMECVMSRGAGKGGGTTSTIPIMSIRSYRLSPNFPQQMFAHLTFSNRLNPFIPLCPFQLNGRCADQQCVFQHEEEYSLSDQQIVEEMLASCPKIVPQGVKKAEFAAKILAKGPLEEVLSFLIASMPEGARSSCLQVDQNKGLSRYFRADKPVPRDEQIEYDSNKRCALSQMEGMPLLRCDKEAKENHL